MCEHVSPKVVYAAVEAYCIGIGVEDSFTAFSESESHWISLCDYATSLIKEDYQFDDPSPFKVVAAVSLAIAKMADIPKHLSDAAFAGQGIESIEDFNCPRLIPCIAAVRVGIARLHNAEVGPFNSVTGEGRKLSEKIKISRHYCKDLAHALSKEARAEFPRIGQLSLIYESLAYKCNGGAEDGE